MVPDYEGIDQKINDMIHSFNRGIDVREDLKEIYALLGVVRVSVLLVASKSLKLTIDSQLDFSPNGSP